MQIGKYIRNIYIMLVTLCGATFVYRILLKKKQPLVRVVVFHDVTDGTWFSDVLTMLRKNYHIVTPADFFVGRFALDTINILVTFDDGYASWVDVCLPLLSEKKVQGLFFINSGLVDVHTNPELQAAFVRDRLVLSPKQTIDWDGVRTLRDAGHCIGGHSTTHRQLSELEESEMERDIRDDKVRIETVLGEGITAFAYPFGRAIDFTSRTRDVAKNAGYKHIFSTRSAFVGKSEPYNIPRLCLEDGLRGFALRAWVGGGYDLYTKIKKICAQ